MLIKHTLRRSPNLSLRVQTPLILLPPATQLSISCQESSSASGRWMNTSLRWTLSPLLSSIFNSFLIFPSLSYFFASDSSWCVLIPKKGPGINVIIYYALIIHLGLCNVYSDGEAPNYPALQKWQEQACRPGTSWNRHTNGLLVGQGQTAAHELFWLFRFAKNMPALAWPSTAKMFTFLSHLV